MDFWSNYGYTDLIYNIQDAIFIRWVWTWGWNSEEISGFAGKFKFENHSERRSGGFQDTYVNGDGQRNVRFKNILEANGSRKRVRAGSFRKAGKEHGIHNPSKAKETHASRSEQVIIPRIVKQLQKGLLQTLAGVTCGEGVCTGTKVFNTDLKCLTFCSHGLLSRSGSVQSLPKQS